MTSLGKQQAQTVAALEAGMSDVRVAVCVGVDWSNYLAVVNVNGGQVSMPMVGDAPFPGDNVWVGWLGKKPVCLGRVPKSPLGTVVTGPVDEKVTVLADDGNTYTVTYTTPDLPTSGARVVMDWGAHGNVYGILSSDPVGTNPDLPPSSGAGGAPGGSEVKSGTFNPISSGTWNGSRYYVSSVNCSASEQGAWFYGTVIGDTIPDTATVTVARIHVDEFFNRYPTSLAKLGTHGLAEPTGPPNVTGALEIPRGSGDINILAFADALKTGSAKGIGTNHGGQHKFSPAGTNNSGAIYMEWS